MVPARVAGEVGRDLDRDVAVDAVARRRRRAQQGERALDVGGDEVPVGVLTEVPPPIRSPNCSS